MSNSSRIDSHTLEGLTPKQAIQLYKDDLSLQELATLFSFLSQAARPEVIAPARAKFRRHARRRFPDQDISFLDSPPQLTRGTVKISLSSGSYASSDSSLRSDFSQTAESGGDQNHDGGEIKPEHPNQQHEEQHGVNPTRPFIPYIPHHSARASLGVLRPTEYQLFMEQQQQHRHQQQLQQQQSRHHHHYPSMSSSSALSSQNQHYRYHPSPRETNRDIHNTLTSTRIKDQYAHNHKYYQQYRQQHDESFHGQKSRQSNSTKTQNSSYEQQTTTSFTYRHTSPQTESKSAPHPVFDFDAAMLRSKILNTNGPPPATFSSFAEKNTMTIDPSSSGSPQVSVSQDKAQLQHHTQQQVERGQLAANSSPHAKSTMTTPTSPSIPTPTGSGFADSSFDHNLGSQLSSYEDEYEASRQISDDSSSHAVGGDVNENLQSTTDLYNPTRISLGGNINPSSPSKSSKSGEHSRRSKTSHRTSNRGDIGQSMHQQQHSISLTPYFTPQLSGHPPPSETPSPLPLFPSESVSAAEGASTGKWSSGQHSAPSTANPISSHDQHVKPPSHHSQPDQSTLPSSSSSSSSVATAAAAVATKLLQSSSPSSSFPVSRPASAAQIQSAAPAASLAQSQLTPSQSTSSATYGVGVGSMSMDGGDSFDGYYDDAYDHIYDRNRGRGHGQSTMSGDEHTSFHHRHHQRRTHQNRHAMSTTLSANLGDSMSGAIDRVYIPPQQHDDDSMSNHLHERPYLYNNPHPQLRRSPQQQPRKGRLPVLHRKSSSIDANVHQFLQTTHGSSPVLAFRPSLAAASGVNGANPTTTPTPTTLTPTLPEGEEGKESTPPRQPLGGRETGAQRRPSQHLSPQERPQPSPVQQVQAGQEPLNKDKGHGPSSSLDRLSIATANKSQHHPMDGDMMDFLHKQQQQQSYPTSRDRIRSHSLSQLQRPTMPDILSSSSSPRTPSDSLPQADPLDTYFETSWGYRQSQSQQPLRPSQIQSYRRESDTALLSTYQQTIAAGGNSLLHGLTPYSSSPSPSSSSSSLPPSPSSSIPSSPSIIDPHKSKYPPESQKEPTRKELPHQDPDHMKATPHHKRDNLHHNNKNSHDDNDEDDDEDDRNDDDKTDNDQSFTLAHASSTRRHSTTISSTERQQLLSQFTRINATTSNTDVNINQTSGSLFGPSRLRQFTGRYDTKFSRFSQFSQSGITIGAGGAGGAGADKTGGKSSLYITPLSPQHSRITGTNMMIRRRLPHSSNTSFNIPSSTSPSRTATAIKKDHTTTTPPFPSIPPNLFSSLLYNFHIDDDDNSTFSLTDSNQRGVHELLHTNPAARLVYKYVHHHGRQIPIPQGHFPYGHAPQGLVSPQTRIGEVGLYPPKVPSIDHQDKSTQVHHQTQHQAGQQQKQQQPHQHQQSSVAIDLGLHPQYIVSLIQSDLSLIEHILPHYFHWNSENTQKASQQTDATIITDIDMDDNETDATKTNTCTPSDTHYAPISFQSCITAIVDVSKHLHLHLANVDDVQRTALINGITQAILSYQPTQQLLPSASIDPSTPSTSTETEGEGTSPLPILEADGDNDNGDDANSNDENNNDKTTSDEKTSDANSNDDKSGDAMGQAPTPPPSPKSSKETAPPPSPKSSNSTTSSSSSSLSSSQPPEVVGTIPSRDFLVAFFVVMPHANKLSADNIDALLQRLYNQEAVSRLLQLLTACHKSVYEVVAILFNYYGYSSPLATLTPLTIAPNDAVPAPVGDADAVEQVNASSSKNTILSTLTTGNDTSKREGSRPETTECGNTSSVRHPLQLSSLFDPVLPHALTRRLDQLRVELRPVGSPRDEGDVGGNVGENEVDTTAYHDNGNVTENQQEEKLVHVPQRAVPGLGLGIPRYEHGNDDGDPSLEPMETICFTLAYLSGLAEDYRLVHDGGHHVFQSDDDTDPERLFIEYVRTLDYSVIRRLIGSDAYRRRFTSNLRLKVVLYILFLFIQSTIMVYDTGTNAMVCWRQHHQHISTSASASPVCQSPPSNAFIDSQMDRIADANMTPQHILCKIETMIGKTHTAPTTAIEQFLEGLHNKDQNDMVSLFQTLHRQLPIISQLAKESRRHRHALEAGRSPPRGTRHGTASRSALPPLAPPPPQRKQAELTPGAFDSSFQSYFTYTYPPYTIPYKQHQQALDVADTLGFDINDLLSAHFIQTQLECQPTHYSRQPNHHHPHQQQFSRPQHYFNHQHHPHQHNQQLKGSSVDWKSSAKVIERAIQSYHHVKDSDSGSDQSLESSHASSHAPSPRPRPPSQLDASDTRATDVEAISSHRSRKHSKETGTLSISLRIDHCRHALPQHKSQQQQQQQRQPPQSSSGLVSSPSANPAQSHNTRPSASQQDHHHPNNANTEKGKADTTHPLVWNNNYNHTIVQPRNIRRVKLHIPSLPQEYRDNLQYIYHYHQQLPIKALLIRSSKSATKDPEMSPELEPTQQSLSTSISTPASSSSSPSKTATSPPQPTLSTSQQAPAPKRAITAAARDRLASSSLSPPPLPPPQLLNGVPVTDLSSYRFAPPVHDCLNPYFYPHCYIARDQPAYFYILLTHNESSLSTRTKKPTPPCFRLSPLSKPQAFARAHNILSSVIRQRTTFPDMIARYSDCYTSLTRLGVVSNWSEVPFFGNRLEAHAINFECGRIAFPPVSSSLGIHIIVKIYDGKGGPVILGLPQTTLALEGGGDDDSSSCYFLNPSMSFS